MIVIAIVPFSLAIINVTDNYQSSTKKVTATTCTSYASDDE